jgi:hypothetical protein
MKIGAMTAIHYLDTGNEFIPDLSIHLEQSEQKPVKRLRVNHYNERHTLLKDLKIFSIFLLRFG